MESGGEEVIYMKFKIRKPNDVISTQKYNIKNSHQEHEYDTHAADHERLAPNLVEDKPARDGADEVDSVLPPAQLERIAVRDASLLVEKRR